MSDLNVSVPGKFKPVVVTRKWIYELGCTSDPGQWGICPDGLWGPDLATRADRLHSSARKAAATLSGLRDSWRRLVKSGECKPGHLPEFAVERHSAYEWLWCDDEEECARVVDLVGRVSRDACPAEHREYLIAFFDGRAAGWGRESARLAGASSLTHTFRLYGGALRARADEVRAW